MGSLYYSLFSTIVVLSLVLYNVEAKPSMYENNRYSEDAVWQSFPRAQSHSQGYKEPAPQKNSLKCDCYVRLDVKTAKAEWFCGTTSDYECQYLSLEKLQKTVQTEAETNLWEEKRIILLAQEMSEPAPCICSVKVGLANTPTQYYCNGLSCYLLAKEMSTSSEAKSQTIELSGSACPRSFDPSTPCCRCVYNKWVCSDSHCPIPPCAEPHYYSGHCCPMCPGDVLPLKSAAATADHDECMEDLKNKPCCRCYHGKLNCVDPNTFCGHAPCSNPVNAPGICCPTCQASEQSHGDRCRYYRQDATVIQTQAQCGCDIKCLRNEQDKCELMMMN